MIRKRKGWGRPVTYKTWFAVWMEMHRFTIEHLARSLCYSGMQVNRWRSGRGISWHAAQLVRARWPDAPVHLRGGKVASIGEPIPINTRSIEFYKFLFQMAGIIGEKTIAPIALEQARGIVVGSKPE